MGASFVKASFSVIGFAVVALSLPGCTTQPSQPAPLKKESNVNSTLDIDSLWNFSNPAESEQAFRNAITSANANEALELDTQIARTYGLRRDSKRALEILDSVQQRITASTSEAVRVRLALERGRTLRTPQDFEVARPHFQEAFDRAIAANLTLLAIDAAHMFGFSKDLNEAQRWNQRAMDLAQSIEVPRAIQWRASIANNMGVSERGLGNLQAAMTHFESVLAAEIRLNRPARIRLAHWQIANTKRLQGHIDEAVAIQLRLEKEADQAKSADVYVYSELAQLFSTPTHAKRDLAEAKRYALLALALAEKDTWMVKNEAELIAKLRGIQSQ